MIKELVEYIVKQLVDAPEHVVISINQEEHQDVVEIKVHAQDRGKIIGKHGQTIKALRTLVNVVADASKKIIIDVAQ